VATFPEEDNTMSTKQMKAHHRRNKAAPLNGAGTRLDSDTVVIEYPSSGETLWSDRYTLRIAAEVDGYVEAAMDGGPWQACRASDGYWWFDWSGYKPGRHEAAVRLTAADGKIHRGNDVEFRVEFAEIESPKQESVTA